MENQILPQGLQVPNRQGQIRLIKSAVLAFLAVLGFALTWQLVAIGFGSSANLTFWIWPSLTAALAITFLALLNVVNQAKWLMWTTTALILATYLLVMPKAWPVVAGSGIFFLLCLWFERRIKHDETTRTDFSLSRVMRGSMTIMVYALLLVIGLNVYVKTQESFKQNPQQFYNRLGHYATQGLQYVPGGWGNFTGNPIFGDVVSGWIAEKVESTASAYQNLFPLIFAVIVVVLLRGLAFLFIWLTMLVSMLVFKVLLALKFFKIEKVQVEVDKLQI